MLARLAPALRFALAAGLVGGLAAGISALREDIEAPMPDPAVAAPSFVTRPETPAQDRRPPRPAATPADFAAALVGGAARRTVPALDYVQPLGSPQAMRPKRLCAALEAAGFDNEGWRQSEVYPGSFECASLAPEPDAAPSPFFFVVRGAGERALSAAMLKTNAEAASDPAEIEAGTLRFLQILADAGILLPPGTPEAIIGPGTVDGRSTLGAVKARAEYDAPKRRILSLTFARRLDVPTPKATCSDACGAAFAALRRTVPPVSVKSRAF